MFEDKQDEIHEVCGKSHMGPGISCNYSRFVRALMIDLDPIIGRYKPAALTIILWNLKEYPP